MQILLALNLLVTATLVVGLILIRRTGGGSETRVGVAKVGLGSAFTANIVLLIWFAMWKKSPPIFPAEYWRFFGCAAIAGALALTAFVAGWLTRGLKRLLLVSSGTLLGTLSILVGVVSIRVS